MSSRRPGALVAAQGLWLLAAVPFLVIGLAARLGPRDVRHDIGAELPRLAVYALTHRLPAAGLWLGVVAFLVLVFRVGPGRRRARTAAVALAGLYDAVLVMALLADEPRPGRLLAGAAVVVTSLTGVVLSYQPPVERYLEARPVAQDGVQPRLGSGGSSVGA